MNTSTFRAWVLPLFLLALSISLAGFADATGGTIRGVQLENTQPGRATVTIRSAEGRVLSRVAVPGRSTRYVALNGARPGLQFAVERVGTADAASILFGGAARESSGASGSSHSHNGEACNDPNCSRGGGSGSARRGSGEDMGALVSEVIAAAGRTRRSEGGGGQTIDGVKIVIDEELPSTVIEIDDGEREPAHHCQGGRLVIIVGNFADPAIQASLRWAEGRQAEGHHLHMIGYPTGGSDHSPSWTVPHVPPPPGHRPTSASEIWPRYRTNNRNRSLSDLVATWNDCCHFDEVLVVFHGSQTGSFRGLVENLPKMLNHRPVRKFVIWSCESTDAFYPGTGGAGGERNYRRLAFVVRPKDCPCGCRAGVCTARGPRGERSRCPRVADPVTILASPVVEGRAAKLGLDPGDARAPFTTPNGQLRRITVTEDGAVRAEFIPTGADVFDGCRSKAEPGLIRESSTRVNPDRILEESRIQDPGNYDPARNPYAGPRACPNGEGCFPNAM